ncbi:hypothetical protein BU17DRAFT_51912, partial [Hysterangium stoloniferum]
PTFHGSGDSMEFFSEVLERDPWELAWLFKQWLCKREKNIVEHDTIGKLHIQSTGIIRAGLCNIMNIKRIEMNYTNYETTIVQAHGVILIGFPLNQFVNPSEVTNITDMRQLHNALRSGECKWIQLSQQELDIHAEGCKPRHKDGEVVGKPRKKRCDAGSEWKMKTSWHGYRQGKAGHTIKEAENKSFIDSEQVECRPAEAEEGAKEPRVHQFRLI